MIREEWERRLYEKLAGWVLDALTEGKVRSGTLLANWLDGCTTDLKKSINLAWSQAQPKPKETPNGTPTTTPGTQQKTADRR